MVHPYRNIKSNSLVQPDTFMNQKNVTQCSFCGAHSITELGYLRGLECLDCRAIFSSYLPSINELKEHYARDIPLYESATQGRLWASPLQKYSDKYLRLVRSITEVNESLLDIGSSTTIFPRLAQEAGYRVTSADILQPKITSAVSYKTICLDLNEKISSSESYKIITLFAVLEHVRDVSLAFDNLKNLLAPNGYIILMVPTRWLPFERYEWARSRWFDPPGHLQIPTRDSIYRLTSRKGFFVQEHGLFEVSTIRLILRYGVTISEYLLSLVLCFLRIDKALKRSGIRRISASMEYFILRSSESSSHKLGREGLDSTLQ